MSKDQWLSFPISLSDLQKEYAWEAHMQRMNMGLGPVFSQNASGIAQAGFLENDNQYVKVRGDDTVDLALVKSSLLKLKPWRKGPFDFFGVQIETEWNSALKWARVLELELDLRDREIIDLGCGNGYYMFRMLEHSPKSLLGLDPSSLFNAQFCAVQNLIVDPRIMHLAIGSDQVLDWENCCDLLFCMGVLYHRKSPIDFLNQLRSMVRMGGQLVLETLILEGDEDLCLCPYPAYAKMKNCYHIPTKQVLENWLIRAGWKVTKWGVEEWTTPDEQKSSEWMDFQSLEDFLDPNDPQKTIEGYQAPLRVLLVAEAIR